MTWRSAASRGFLPIVGAIGALAASSAWGTPRSDTEAASRTSDADNINATATAQSPTRAARPPTSVVFMGTGTSSSNPHMNCLLGLNELKKKGGCEVCQKASQGPPELNKNYRGNPSLLILYNGESTEETKYIQFDAGKTFLESAKRWFAKFNVPHLDAVILTHEHADAIFGLDDLRLVQRKNCPLDVFMSFNCYKFVKTSFPYLMFANPNPIFTGAGKFSEESYGKPQLEGPKPTTFVASLRWNVVAGPSLKEPFVPFHAAGMQVIPFPVFHGPTFLSLGFAMGKTNKKFVYISDVSEVPESVMKQLREWDIEYLVVDTLHPEKRYISHFNLEDAIALVEEVKPRKTFLVGVSHYFDHEVDNAKLATLKETKGIDVQVAHDGLKVDLIGVDM